MKNENNTLVILEDEPAHAEAIRKSLSVTFSDCKVLIASSLEEFHRIISDITPGIVIADINLPDGTAFSILNGNIEKQPWPVIVMTSYGDEEMAVKAIKSGALDYIVKSPETFRNIDHVVRRNLREWKNIQKSLENEKKFRMLFEKMAQGVIYQDVNGKIIAANSAAEKITGYTLEQMQESSFFDSPWVSINNDGSITQGETHPALVALRFGSPVSDKVMGIFHLQTDKFVWLLVSAVPQFRGNDPEPYEVFTTLTDITDLKLTELKLKEAKARAEESDRLKSVFLANMSHEIRTPMNGILGFADLLREPEISTEEQKMYIEVINSSGKRMLDIINDLIDISRIEAGQIEIKKENVNILSLLGELLEFFTPEAEEKGIRIENNLQLPSEGFYIETDRTKVAQVITNLIKNALKFTVKSGTIELGCRVQDNYNLYFFVKDSGEGIRKELQDKIFERFRQGDKANEHEGVGLGLAISKAYVEMLGGRIGLESEPGKGSVFFFTLPYTGQISIQKSFSEEFAL